MNEHKNKQIGKQRFDRFIKIRPSKPLKDKDHLLFHHALMCKCQKCERLLDWNCDENDSTTITECCGLAYRLLPWTVKVEVTDVSSRPIISKMAGSNYPDPNFQFDDGPSEESS